MLARDLELSLEAGVIDDEGVEDMRLIRSELDRCRGILDSMASAAGESVGEEWTGVSASEWLNAASAALSAKDRVDLCVDEALGDRPFRLPKRAVCQALGAIVQNALQASSTTDRVELRARFVDDSLAVTVVDRGSGMSDETLRRAGEPFFTTKEPGSGMGLGLFLARRVIERLDGSLTIESTVDVGTTVTIRLPVSRSSEAGNLQSQRGLA
jgi:two-component system sensor histidine kinase RegB